MEWKIGDMENIIVLSAILYIIYLIYEKYNCKRVRRNFKHVIHVNGTRGKSTVSRLIDAGLREAGFSVFTKTTGTSPRIIHTDGHESEIVRRGKANIREQIKIMREAAAEKADILVIECMAVKPELQLVCQRDILGADIGVITNARLDHQDEMGNSLDDVIKALGSTMPHNGVLFTADERAYGFYKELSYKNKTEVFLANEISEDFQGIDFLENVALAYKVCEYLGVDRQIALKGMRNYKKDPGSLKIYGIKNKNGCRIEFINALAANDPDSTERIFRTLDIEKDKRFQYKVMLVNNRIDRVSRMEQYIEFIINMESYFHEFWIIGDLKNVMKRRLIKGGIKWDRIKMLKDIDYVDSLRKDTLIFAVGNIGGYGRNIVRYLERVGELDAG